MSVRPTDEWLNNFIIVRKRNHDKSLEEIHCSILCNPLVDVFIDFSPEEIQYVLLQNGLFQAHEEIAMEALEKQDTWKIVQEEFERLKKQWNGPNVPIYIFPINQEQTFTRKNGVSYPNGLFLFIASGLEKEELKALFAHEYNHVCRLQYINKSLDEMTLSDSLILEGLAECAVEELYGNKRLAPWLKSYSMEDLLKIWESDFVPVLDVQGVHNHFDFLYGGKLPKWIGYCIGYEIVRTYKKNFPTSEPYLKSAVELVAGSDFPLQ
ncbi:hypothetical protein FOH38_11055 [Lysinibacillus fusiformis]|nr:hypothetical protein FOH38_11055 [Lysinibacillus fusiformis]